MKRKLRFKFKLSENDVKAQIKDYFTIMGWFWFYNLQGLGSYDGIPDFIAIKNGRTIYLEAKKPGGTQSPGQIEFERNITYQKGEYCLIDCLEDLIKIIG